MLCYDTFYLYSTSGWKTLNLNIPWLYKYVSVNNTLFYINKNNIFIVYKTKCCVMTATLYLCYNTSGWKTLNLNIPWLYKYVSVNNILFYINKNNIFIYIKQSVVL